MGTIIPQKQMKPFGGKERYREKHRSMHICVYMHNCTYISVYIMGTLYVHICIT